MQHNIYGVIMAGGVGSRFWPLSRSAKPKQFLDILGVGRTFIQQTFDRLTKFIPAENIVVVTSAQYKQMVQEQLPEVQEENILLEPLRRNTAPCIAYAAYKLQIKSPDATMVVAPSDHLILKENEFVATMKNAIEFARTGSNLVTVGIEPSRPETGYGYIQTCKGKDDNNICKVKTFTEKPDIETAKAFLSSGEFVWNSGMFIWTLSSICTAFEAHLPEVAKAFSAGKSKYYAPDEDQFIEETYTDCKSISIDYGIMEKADNVHVICADFGWSDVGTWNSLYLHSEKDEHNNAMLERSVSQSKVSNSIVKTMPNKLTVLHDLDSYLVVDTDDVLMICKRGDENELKQIVTNAIMESGMKMA
ncbi:MAG: mannose-1-phosphate guanylyltransferase [Prevotellaceae bacterium]|jgi:mannose-1-phosphate guanylyltransferase|nr:mannose-1-phosphate guanylyltransferase [Prevotellaceae bacterium]